jgi:hypothetical protein
MCADTMAEMQAEPHDWTNVGDASMSAKVS